MIQFLPWILKAAPWLGALKGAPWKLVGALLLAALSGWAGWQAATWRAAEAHASALEADLERQRAAHEAVLRQRDLDHAAATRARETAHREALAVARDRPIVSEVTRHVPDDRACDLSPAAVGLLDQARRGGDPLPGAPPAPERADGAARAPAAPGGLPQRVEVAAHADCGLRYREVAGRLRALQQFLEDTRTDAAFDP